MTNQKKEFQTIFHFFLFLSFFDHILFHDLLSHNFPTRVVDGGDNQLSSLIHGLMTKNMGLDHDHYLIVDARQLLVVGLVDVHT